MAAPRYKTELFIPIKQDNKSFEERQKSIFSDAEKEFTSRSFKDDFGKDFGKDFGSFPSSSLRSGLPSSIASTFGSDPFGDGETGSMMERMQSRMEARRKDWDHEIERMRKDFFSLKPSDNKPTDSLNRGSPGPYSARDDKFSVSFDVSQFKPEEIKVRTEDNKLIVHAKHDDIDGGRTSTREFSRQVDIPRHIDVHKLNSTMTSDGVLQVESENPAPSYESLLNGRGNTFASSSQSSDRTSISDSFPPSSMPTLGGGSLKKGPVVTAEDGSKTLRMEVDIGAEFSASDLNIKTVDNKLQIHAKHEEKTAGRTSCREFSREFDLPDDVNPDAVTASMSEDGKLLIEAPISSYNKGSYQGKVGSSKQPTVIVSMKK